MLTYTKLFCCSRCKGQTYHGDSWIGVAVLFILADGLGKQELLDALNGSQGLVEGAHGLGQDDQGETQDVAEGQQDEGHAGIDFALPVLVADEDGRSHQGRRAKHHGQVHGLDDGGLDVQLHLTSTHLRGIIHLR